MARLYELEHLGVLTSKLEKKGQDYVRVFTGTEVAKRIAKIINGQT